MAELNFEVKNEPAQSIIPPDEYWSDHRKNYNAKQVGEMPFWISVMKKRDNPDWCVSPIVVDVKSLNKLHYLTYKFVKDNFTISSENLNLFLLIKSIAGSGKRYVIHALRNLLQSKCLVLAYTGKATMDLC